MLKRALRCVAFVVCLLASIVNVSVAQRGGGGSQCIAPDSNSTAMVNELRRMIRGTNVHLDSLRDRIGFGGVDTSSVTVVTSSKTCASAAGAIDQLAHIATSGRLVYVVQVGRSRFVVTDPNDKSGEWNRGFVLDSHFNFIASLAM